MSLTLSAQPGFTEIAEASFNAGATLSATVMKALNADAKFAAVRNEQFWGYYCHGETVQLPVSPADGYEYSREELVYTWSIYWTGSATAACNGTQTPPTLGSTTGGGTILQQGFNIDQATGEVSCRVDYYNGGTNVTTDGILLVMVHAQRDR
jgi:hypothetical protein